MNLKDGHVVLPSRVIEPLNKIYPTLWPKGIRWGNYKGNVYQLLFYPESASPETHEVVSRLLKETS